MNLLSRLARTCAELLREDERRVLAGEDVAEGTMLGLSRVAAEDPSLRERLVSTPLCPTTAMAHVGGLAIGGLRPIVLLSSIMPLIEGLAGLRETCLLGWRTGGQIPAPVVFLAPFGPGFGLGADATEGTEAILTRLPGLRVVVSGDPEETPALVRAAAEFWAGDEPTIVLIPRRFALVDISDDAKPQLERPFGGARVLRRGPAATVFTWGETVGDAMAAVDASGADATVVDIESLSPLDTDNLVSAARATGKLVIAGSGPTTHGPGAELAALFADQAILQLDAPVMRVGGAPAPLPPGSEDLASPSIDQIARAITHVATY